jgi:hypothetical protein
MHEIYIPFVLKHDAEATMPFTGIHMQALRPSDNLCIRTDTIVYFPIIHISLSQPSSSILFDYFGLGCIGAAKERVVQVQVAKV